MLTQAQVIAHYLALAFVPAPLAFTYGWPMVTSIGAVVPQVVLLGGLFAVTAYAVLKRQRWAFIGVWFFLTGADASLATRNGLPPDVMERID